MSFERRYALSAGELDELLDELGAPPRDLPRKGAALRRPVPRSEVRSALEGARVDYSFRVIAHLNLKGGIGKTTCAITTATRAAQLGFKTCLIDLDSQGSASLAFDVLPEEGQAIFYDVWAKPEELVAGALQCIGEDLYLLPSNLENGLLDISLANPKAQKTAVAGVCAALRAMHFDLVLIDCPPSLGAAIISSICAADDIVVPVGSDAFSIKGMQLTLGEVDAIAETFGLRKPRMHVLHGNFDARQALSVTTLKRLRELASEAVVPYVIRTSAEFAKALEKRETVFAGTRKSPARADYDRYVRYILGMNERTSL